MAKRVRNGKAINIAPGMVYIKGNNPNKIDDVDIGPNNEDGMSLNDKEIATGVVASKNGKEITPIANTIKIFSAEPILGGVSPAQLLYGGANPNAVFAAQEQYKRANKIADDGSHYKKGGQTQTPVKKGIDWSGIATTNNRGYNADYIDYINNGLIKAGIGKNQRAAILANIIEESGGNPFAVDSTGKFKGVLQWEQSRYWPGDETDPYKELDNQIQYIIDTAGNATDRKSWTHGGKGSGYNSLTDAMAAYNSEDDLAATMRGYTLGYVRPAGGVNTYNNRYKVAEQIIGREGFRFGGEEPNNSFKIVKQRTDFQPTKFKSFLRKLYTNDNSDQAINRYGDFSRMYFGLPLQNGLLYESNYKPSISTNPNAKYYGVFDGKFIHDVIELYNHPGFLEKPHTGVINGYSTKGNKQYPWQGDYVSEDLARDLHSGKKIKLGKTPHTLGPGALGNFTVGRGKDEKGEYLSYYDIWDVAPERSKNAERRGFAKPYEIYDRIYGTFDDDGTFHPEGEIPAAVVTAEKKYGGIHIKPSKRGTFTAAAKKHGMSVQGFASKVLANKDNYSSAMVKKANFAHNAKRWHHLYGGEDSLLNPLGERHNAKSNNMKQNKRNKALDGTEWYRDPATGLMMPKVGLPMEPISQAPKQIMVGEQRNILNTPFDTRTFHEGVVEPKIITIPNKMRGLYDSLSSINPIQSTTSVKTSSPNFWQKAGNFLGSAQGADLIGALVNAGGAIGSAIINNKAINKLKYTDKQYTIYNPAKLKTKININPQVTKMRETVAGLSDAVRRTSASSRKVYQGIANARLAALDSYRSLLGEKENKETELINQDRLNQQQVGMQTAKDMMNTINTNIAGKDNVDNTKPMLKAQNNVALVNNFAGITKDLLARRDARISQAANLAAMSLPYPDAARLLQGDTWKNAFKGYYNMINNQIGV